MNVTENRLACASVAPIRPGGYLRELDGLRGVAILMVLLVHFYQGALIGNNYPLVNAITGRIAEAGRYGVELFFVLSGFLITGILLDSKGKGNFLRTFYMRRVLRIFPLYYGSLILALLVLPNFVALDDSARQISRHQVWLWTYLANLPGIPVDWDGSNIVKFGHFWSLCVEEHFYLVWPALVLLLQVRWLFKLCLGIVSASLLCRALPYFMEGAPTILSWATLQKSDGLAIGAIIAIALRDPKLVRKLPTGRSFQSITTLLSLFFLLVIAAPYRMGGAVGILGDTVVVCLGGCVLLAALRARPGSIFSRILNSGVLVSFGVYSYGLYVIHGMLRPVLERIIAVDRLPGGPAMGIVYMIAYYVPAICVTYGLAYASYNLFEKRFLALKRFWPYGEPGQSKRRPIQTRSMVGESP